MQVSVQASACLKLVTVHLTKANHVAKSRVSVREIDRTAVILPKHCAELCPRPCVTLQILLGLKFASGWLDALVIMSKLL